MIIDEEEIKEKLELIVQEKKILEDEENRLLFELSELDT